MLVARDDILYIHAIVYITGQLRRQCHVFMPLRVPDVLVQRPQTNGLYLQLSMLLSQQLVPVVSILDMNFTYIDHVCLCVY